MPLTPSQRATLITGVATVLNRENRFEIVAILHQFGLETETEASYGDDKAYILAVINDAPDKTLLGLGEHCGIFVEMSCLVLRTSASFSLAF